MRFMTAGKEGLATVIGVQKVCRIIRVEGLLHLMDATLHYFIEFGNQLLTLLTFLV